MQHIISTSWPFVVAFTAGFIAHFLIRRIVKFRDRYDIDKQH